MLKEVGASGQISLGKKYAGQLFDMQIAEDGCVKLTPVKVVPLAQEERAVYRTGEATPAGDGWLTPERLAKRQAGAARTPAEMESARSQWEEENKESIKAMNERMARIGSMGRRVHEWRKEQALREQNPAGTAADKAA